MQESKLTVRKVVKKDVELVNKSVDIKIECKDIQVYWNAHAAEDGKIVTYISRGCCELLKEILDLEVDKYEFEKSNIPKLYIRTNVFAERHVL